LSNVIWTSVNNDKILLILTILSLIDSSLWIVMRITICYNRHTSVGILSHIIRRIRSAVNDKYDQFWSVLFPTLIFIQNNSVNSDNSDNVLFDKNNNYCTLLWVHTRRLHQYHGPVHGVYTESPEGDWHADAKVMIIFNLLC